MGSRQIRFVETGSDGSGANRMEDRMQRLLFVEMDIRGSAEALAERLARAITDSCPAASGTTVKSNEEGMHH
jgi:hypothetical protein